MNFASTAGLSPFSRVKERMIVMFYILITRSRYNLSTTLRHISSFCMVMNTQLTCCLNKKQQGCFHESMIFLNMAFRAVSYVKTIILRLFLTIMQVWYDLSFEGDNPFCINMVIFANKGITNMIMWHFVGICTKQKKELQVRASLQYHNDSFSNGVMWRIQLSKKAPWNFCAVLEAHRCSCRLVSYCWSLLAERRDALRRDRLLQKIWTESFTKESTVCQEFNKLNGSSTDLYRQPRDTGRVSFFESCYNPLTYGQ